MLKIQEAVKGVRGDDEKIDAIQKALGTTKERAENVYRELFQTAHSMDDLTDKQYNAYSAFSATIPESEYIKYVNALEATEGQKGANGKTISGSVKKARYQKLLSMGMPDQQARELLTALYNYNNNY